LFLSYEWLLATIILLLKNWLKAHYAKLFEI
jgi:hypothetical protein